MWGQPPSAVRRPGCIGPLSRPLKDPCQRPRILDLPHPLAKSFPLPRLRLCQPPTPQLLSRNARKQRFDIKYRRPIEHIHTANMQLDTLAPKQFDNRQSNRIRPSRRPCRKHSMCPIVSGRCPQQFEPMRPIKLPDDDQMREALDVGKPRLKLGQYLEHTIGLVLSAQPLGNLACALVRTTNKSNRPRCKHWDMLHCHTACRAPARLAIPNVKSCHPVSNDAAPCQGFLGDTPASTPKAAPFRSSRTPLMSRPSSPLSSILQRDLRPHHPSLRDLLPRLLTSISLTLHGGRLPTQRLGSLLAGHGMTRAHLHDGLTQLRVRPVFAQHQVQPRGQLPGHGHFGDAAIPAFFSAVLFFRAIAPHKSLNLAA
jgi:hypothetical protein